MGPLYPSATMDDVEAPAAKALPGEPVPTGCAYAGVPNTAVPQIDYNFEPVYRRRHVYLAPFYIRTYAQMMYFLLLSFPLALGAFCWCATTVAFALGSIPLCGFGLVFFPICSYSWRFLAWLQVELTKVFCPHEDPTKMALMEPVWFCKNFFKGNWCNPLTWKSLGFFLFVQIIWSIFTFAVQLATLSTALTALSLPVLFLTQKNAAAGCDNCSFIISNGWASFLLIPIGILLFYLTCIVTCAMAEAERNITWSILPSRVVDSRHFNSLTCIQGERTALSAGPNDTPVAVALPEKPSVTGTRAKADIPNAYMHTYARRSPCNVCLTVLCCFCCLLCTAGICSGIAFALLSARCGLAERSTHTAAFEYDLRGMTSTSQVGVTDLYSIVGQGSVNIVQNASEPYLVRTAIEYSWVPLEDGDKYSDYYEATQATGLVDIGDLTVSSNWQKLLLCTKVTVTITLPVMPAGNMTVERGTLTVTMAGSYADISSSVTTAAVAPFSSLQVETTNGHIDMPNTFGSALEPMPLSVSVETTNGHIELGTMYVNGSLSATTTNGHIEGNTLGAASVQLQTTNGHVEVDSLPLVNSTLSYPSISVQTTNGKVELSAVYFAAQGDKNVDVSTNNGRVEVTTYAFAGQFDIQTSNGNIQLQAGAVSYNDNSRYSKSGSIGSGNNDLSVTTTNGNVQVVAL